MGKIIITGAAGFIASRLAIALGERPGLDLVYADDFSVPAKQSKIKQLPIGTFIDRYEFVDWFASQAGEVDFVFHLGARTDTTEFDFRVFDSLNLSYSKAIWEICTTKQIPFIYASSAATYGMGERGFGDDEARLPDLKPLNPYGLSKQLFDMYVLEQDNRPPFWAGLKFFNVYGYGESHKGRMASVIYHAYHQILTTGGLKLFQSHHADYADGMQLRDFIHVDDIIAICMYLYDTRSHSGIYNAGTGQARSFNDLGQAVFAAMAVHPHISYIPIPVDIRDRYQYFTEAEMTKLKSIGFTQPFTTLEQGVTRYINALVAAASH
jgi:ADP-L-glycero-D-manno-heptose 6-epimerase